MTAAHGPHALLRRQRRRLLAGIVVLAMLAVAPLPLHDAYAQNLLIIALMYAGLAQAWNILGGTCGQVSLGHAVYFGIGAYAGALLTIDAGVPPPLGLILAALAGGAAALLVGWPCFRLSGHYYAIATVVVGEVAYLLVLNWDAVGGATGVYLPFHGGDSWLWLQFRTAKYPFHIAMLAYAALCWLVAWALTGARLGYAWRAVADDVTAARSLGVNVFRSKLAAAGISGALTAIGGALYAQYVGYIDPDSVLSGQLSILIALPAVLGGVGTLWGPLIGAAVLTPLSEVTRSWLGGSGRGFDLTLYGGLIVLVSLARPQGLQGLRLPASWTRRRAVP